MVCVDCLATFREFACHDLLSRKWKVLFRVVNLLTSLQNLIVIDDTTFTNPETKSN